jgi:hypothetical protein
MIKISLKISRYKAIALGNIWLTYKNPDQWFYDDSMFKS